MNELLLILAMACKLIAACAASFAAGGCMALAMDWFFGWFLEL